ncbi:hypothetical protein SS1G_12665 [Sclerotinia sclerotiorum 1980 UF-70]|uniref:Uncharacterized protein n=1 Tax=Sclerotinia sclerotiorum (strain ATCC 18683 / 1980 / Ss-1) TaxID=665079 RepID=A7F4Z0_SCLS1|nr:hypothetical protein SS1G_12665 [Sclerotinia sclerotiorum 1980 UF-70]EDN97811.1 hypothetical protein SS1G_12665 [Sclerotinia sclerotiorum 1980 UF-70]
MVDEDFLRRWPGLAVVEVLDEVQMYRFKEVMGGLERSFTGSDVAADVFRIEVDRASPFVGSLLMFARVDGGRMEALLLPIELVAGGRVEVEVLEAVDMVVLRGLIVGKRLGEAVPSGAAATGLRIDLVLDGIVDMIYKLCMD